MDTEKKPAAPADRVSESYRLAKLIRQANRELERQMNTKKTK